MADPLADLVDEDGEESPVKEKPAKKARSRGAADSGKQAQGSDNKEDSAPEKSASSKDIPAPENGKKRGRSRARPKDANAGEKEPAEPKNDAKTAEAKNDAKTAEAKNDAKTAEAKPAAEAKDEAKPAAKEDAKPADAEAAKPSEPAAESAQEEKYFKVRGNLNLKMGLQVNKIYSASDLWHRCRAANLGNKAKLEQLRQCMCDPSKLEVVKGLPQYSRKSAASASARSSQDPGSSSKRQRTAAPDEAASSTPSAPSAPPCTPNSSSLRFVTGQVCWHIGDSSSRLAKVFAESPDRSYSVGYVKDITSPNRVINDIPVHKLKPFNIKDLPIHIMNGDFRIPDYSAMPAGLSEPAAVRPGKREASEFKVGQIVWYQGQKMPSWPARIKELPSEDDDKYRLQLYHPRPVVEGEAISACASELIACEKNDMAAYFQVAKRAYEDIIEFEASASKATA